MSALPPFPSPPLLIALSGPTSSGKTTLAHALTRILPNTLLIHADDFYRPDSEIPLTEDGLQDWDCAGALDLERMWAVLEGVKRGEGVPEGLVRQEGVDDGVHGPASGEGQDGDGGVSRSVVERLRGEVRPWMEGVLKGRRIVIVEGFLLFGKSLREKAREVFDVKILLRVTYETAKKRREKRNGYVTLEGFWKDPEGYFEGVVWPGFVREHEWLFEGGNVEGEVREEVEGGEWGSVVVGPNEEGGLDSLVEWVVGRLRGEIEDISKAEGREVKHG